MDTQFATIAAPTMPLTPQMKGIAAVTCWMRGITKEDRQQARNQILAARQQDIRNLADLVDACMKQEVLCVFGGQEKIDANKQVFGEIHSAL